MKIVMKKPDELKHFENNPRYMSEDEMTKLVNSIKEFGMVDPLIIDEEGVIIGGNQRYEAGLKLNLEDYPCVIVEGLSDAKKKTLNIALNKIMGEWDDIQLASVLMSIKSEDKDLLSYTGFDEKEINILINAIGETNIPVDDVEPNAYELAKSKTKIITGDVFILGNHRLMCGDATKSDDVDKLMNGEKADLLLTDPPYGINIVKADGKIGFGNGRLGFDNKTTNRNKFGSIGRGGIVPVGKHKMIEGDDKPFNPEFLLSYGKNQIIFGGNYFANKLPESSCWLVWDKREDIPSNNFADCELAWTSFKKPSRIIRWKWSGLIRAGERKT